MQPPAVELPPLPQYPSLYQVNTRVWLTELSEALGRPATLDDLPDADLDRFAEKGFEWIWLLTVWQTGAAGQRISRANREWRKEFQQTLPDLRESDIAGSGFAIAAYTVHAQMGGDAALARLRERLRRRGLRLLLDFVPNHTAQDHPWVEEHPDYYIAGTEQDLQSQPGNYTRLESSGGLIFAYGRDPYFPGWPDTLQLNYANPATQGAVLAQMIKVAGQCDGVRCDMAMLMLPEVFERTWGLRSAPFWPNATREVRAQYPDFCFMGEVYWDLEWTLQQQGFDYTYDKRLYDRLRSGEARPVRDHLKAGLEYQDKLTRFLENHDEARAAAIFPAEVHRAAATIAFLAPGMRFFHQGQLRGFRQRISPHLARGPREAADEAIEQFYASLLAILHRPVVREGRWQMLQSDSAAPGESSAADILHFAWQSDAGEQLLVSVNYAPHASQCYVRLPFPAIADRQCRLRDLLGNACYERDGSGLRSKGLYLEMSPWQYHVFEIAAG